MSYTHHGKVMQNGVIDPGSVPDGSPDLTIKPEDDGLHITDLQPGDFEWWYFDVFDSTSNCFLKIVVHIGTDPLKTRIFPQLAISLSTPERNESIVKPYLLTDLEADTRECNIQIKKDVSISTKTGDPCEYHIHIDISQFNCSLKFTSILEGWKPFGNEVKYQMGRKKSNFSWTIPVPKAVVEGQFACRDKQYNIQDAIGYHDHNYCRVDRLIPLHLDNLVTSWIWGKAYTERFTLIFGDTHCRTSRIQSLMLAEGNTIIHSSNNLAECLVTRNDYDNTLKSRYPCSLKIKLDTADLPVEATLDFDGIMDRKDLLEDVNPVLKWLIKKMVARPAYHGMFARARLRIFENSWDGFGNYESMVFRN
jgi:hypothetical protein